MSASTSRNKRKGPGVAPLRAVGEPAADPAPRPEPDSKVVQHKTGLRWCFDKGSITSAMYEAGERYGRDHRDAEMGDACTIKSSLASLETGGCGGGSGKPIAPAGGIDFLMQIQILHARQERDAVHAHFDYDTGALSVLSAICGRQMTPMEAARGSYQDTESMVRERSKEITAVLRAILTMLSTFYRKRDKAEAQAENVQSGRRA